MTTFREQLEKEALQSAAARVKAANTLRSSIALSRLIDGSLRAWRWERAGERDRRAALKLITKIARAPVNKFLITAIPLWKGELMGLGDRYRKVKRAPAVDRGAEHLGMTELDSALSNANQILKRMNQLLGEYIRLQKVYAMAGRRDR